jgi:V8-like Glu-specific endopeptidase
MEIFMINLKYSFLLSVSLLASIQICWAMIEEDTVSHEFGNSSISYRKGRFEFSEDNSAFYTKPPSPIITIPQCNQIYKETQEDLYIESFSQNGRRQITQTTEWPYRIHGNLTMYEGGITYGGSGVLIGPHHMLTAGHNVYSVKRKKWKDNISVRLGLHESYSPFEERKVIKAYTFRQWVNNGDTCYDMALLLLDDSIGHKIGWSGLLCLDDEGISRETVTITGYPGDYGFTKMMTMSDKVKTVQPEEFYYEINTAGGQSGSGIWINKCGSPYVLGVHTRGGTKEVGNSGARLSTYKFKKIIGWMSQNYVLDNTSAITRFPSLNNNQPNPENVFNLAVKYDTGDGVLVDKSRSIILYMFAAKKGHAGALCKVGDFYKLGDFSYNGKVISQNLKSALHLYRMAAEKNYPQAQFNLGWIHENGQGVLQNQQEALKWYRLAAGQGHQEAISRLQTLELNLPMNINFQSISMLRRVENPPLKHIVEISPSKALLENRKAIFSNTSDKITQVVKVNAPQKKSEKPIPKKIPQPKNKSLKTIAKKVNKRSKKYIQHMKSLENQPKITQYFIPILKVNAN